MDELWPEDDGIGARIERELERLEESGVARIPSVAPSVAPRAVARWVWRVWAARTGSWCPLVHVEHEGEDVSSLEWANPIWSHSEGVEVASPGPRIELTSEPLGVSDAWGQRLMALDRWHGIASDPELAGARSVLLGGCARAQPVHLRGEDEWSKRELTMWAHALLDDRPMVDLSMGAVEPGRWIYAPEVWSLSEGARQSLERAFESQRATLRRHPFERMGPRPDVRAFDAMVGESVLFTEVLGRLVRLAPSALTLLLIGEPGVGKEAMARAAHELSGRRGPMVCVDVGALSPTLLESELFGHVKGAFTGADRARKGAFQQADGGTLFLDEVGNLEHGAQVKLLRALQERQVRPVGADALVDVDVRVITASNQDLEEMVARGEFRLDLLGRLNAATLRLPPLRDRGRDWERIARALLDVAHDATWCTPEAHAILSAHTWQGNVRELVNVVRYAWVLSGEGPIGPEHLGRLSPTERRKVPIITTSSHELEPEDLAAEYMRSARACTVHVPGLSECGEVSRLHHVFERLRRPERLTQDALRELASHPWEGGFEALDDALARIESSGDDVVTLTGVHALCPELRRARPASPMRTILNPRVLGGGRVEGFRREVLASAMVLGRLSHVAELVHLAESEGDRARGWLEVVRARAERPECVALHHPRLSRAHVLLTREPGGLTVYRFEQTGLPVEVRLPDEVRRLGAGEEVGEGDWIELTFGSSGDGTLVLLVCVDDAAERDWARARGKTSAPAPTWTRGAPGASRAMGSVAMWTLDPVEVEALLDMMTGFTSGSFKRHMLEAARGCEDRPELDRLRGFLLKAPRFAQYVTRLFEHTTNGALRDGLKERVAFAPALAARAELWPSGLARLLEE